jgi:hypothetical protein
MRANAPGKQTKDRTWRDELDLVRRPAALLLAALAGAALMVGASSWIRIEKETALAQAARTRALDYAKFRNVENEKSEIQQFQPRFIELRAAGLVGDENRLAWVEAVRQVQEERKLPSVSYEIEPQQALAMDRPLDLGDYRLRGSRMRLHMGLVHELDLFNLLDDLRNAGRFSVENCKLTRNSAPPDAGAAPRVLGECTLVWLTLGSAPAAPAAKAMQ